jgi:hypothetical protein
MAAASVARSQTVERPSELGIVRLAVSDPLGAPLRGVSVSIAVRDSIVARTTTDASGLRTLALEAGPLPYVITLRMIGYVPRRDSVIVSGTDTVTFAVTLARAPVLLDTLRTTTRSLRAEYAISGDEMLRREPNAENVFDAVRKIRPQILGDRMRGCGYVRNLWVNGRWQVLAPWDTIVPLITYETERLDPRGNRIIKRGYIASHADRTLPLGNLDPHHVVEMHYSGCSGQAPLGPRGMNALFVTLKPGIGYEPGVGTFVIDSSTARRKNPNRSRVVDSLHPDPVRPRRPGGERRVEVDDVEVRVDRETVVAHVEDVHLVIALEMDLPEVVLIEEVVGHHEPLVVVGEMHRVRTGVLAEAHDRHLLELRRVRDVQHPDLTGLE